MRVLAEQRQEQAKASTGQVTLLRQLWFSCLVDGRMQCFCLETRTEARLILLQD